MLSCQTKKGVMSYNKFIRNCLVHHSKITTKVTASPIKSMSPIDKLDISNLSLNGKESTVNRALGGSTYPG